MANPLISIIIPVYNAEKYLEKCLDSIVNQTYKNIEIVLVDDGSLDSCPSICDEWANKDSRIVVVHKENGGVSSARNVALDIAKGEYITFIDSDDYIDEKYVEKADEIIEQGYEMIVFNYTKVNGEITEDVIMFDESQEITCPKVINKYFETYCLSTVWKMFYKRDMIIKNNIFFDKGINYGEDMLFSITAYLNSQKTYYLNYCGYFYVFNDNSATNVINIEKRKKFCLDNLKLYERILSLLKKKEIEIEKSLFLDALLRNFTFGLDSIWLIENTERTRTIKEILELYQPYLSEYKSEKSILNKKIRLKLELLKHKLYFPLDVYFKIKRVRRRAK